MNIDFILAIHDLGTTIIWSMNLYNCSDVFWLIQNLNIPACLLMIQQIANTCNKTCSLFHMAGMNGIIVMNNIISSL